LSHRKLVVERRELSVAVNNIPQGLVLYDNSARVTVCNQRYIEMFGLSPEVAKPGCTMHELISHRKDTGSFSGDVGEFCASIKRNVALGKVTHQIVDAADGRAIQIINQPLEAGGWVATIEDVTERKRSDALRRAHRFAQSGVVSRAARTRSQEGSARLTIGGFVYRYRRVQERQRCSGTFDRR
jgi:sensor histidine kinase regulating citrate/malate metabolism